MECDNRPGFLICGLVEGKSNGSFVVYIQSMPFYMDFLRNCSVFLNFFWCMHQLSPFWI